MRAPSNFNVIIAAFLTAISICGLADEARSQPNPTAQCGSEIEKHTWQLWDTDGRGFIRDKMMADQLIKQGDTYALYDTQVYLQNLVSMAIRCGRIDRLRELGGIIDVAYSRLEAIPGFSGSLGWICRGGRVCNSRSRLTGTEVRLTSLQFLVLATQIANGLAQQPDQDERSTQFIGQTLQVVLAHLDRWLQGSDPWRISERLAATPDSVKDGDSRLFFTDQDLWLLALESEVAGILDAPWAASRTRIDQPLRDRISANVRDLSRLMLARLTERTVASKQFGEQKTADLDRGFWRRYGDNRFAAYDDPVGPISCGAGGKRQEKPGFNPKNVPIVDDIGWDFSHARRFVHAFAALDRNHAALMHVLGLTAAELPPMELSKEFAATLVTTVWNKDESWPLFSNYWNGSNGWYRVAYDNGTTGCFAGYGPSGLSDSFATGGFAVWQQYQPIIGTLGMRLFDIAASNGSDEQAFIQQYYPGLSPAASAANRMLTQLMFWPSLVAGNWVR